MGELLALRWRAVDFAGPAVRVRASYYAGHLTTPKSDKVRAVPLAPDVASGLARLGEREHCVRDDDLVFASEGGGYLDGVRVASPLQGLGDHPGSERVAKIV
jgi:integrase